MDVRVGLWRRLSTKELMLLNCGVGEDSWESLGLQGDQPWVFFGRNEAKAETPVLWPPHAKSCLIGKDSDAGRNWGQEEKGTTEDEMAGWHHWLDRHDFEWTPGVGDGQGSLVCCDSLGRKESDTTERLDWTELILSPWRSETSSFGLLFSHTGILLFVAVHRIFLCVCCVCIFWSRQLLVDRKAVDVLCVCILQPVTFWFSSSSQLFSWFS